MVRIRDPLHAERIKLEKKLALLERNFDAKSQVYSKHGEIKKLEKAKKDFQLKREILQVEIASINKDIKQRDTKLQIERDIQHKKEWEKIKSELMGYSDKNFRNFMKQFAQSCIKQRQPLFKLDELFNTIELPDEVIRQSILTIRNGSYDGVCGIRVDPYGFISTQFARELSEIDI